MNKKRIGDICDVLNGFAFKSTNYVDNGIRVIRITNVQKGYIEDDKPEFCPLEEQDNISNYMLKENDLLLSLTGNVGRVALLNKDYLPAALNQRVACLRPKANNINIKYLFYCLLSNKFEEDCIRSSNGIAQKNMSTEWLKNYEIIVPSMDEQLKIVDSFDKCMKILNIVKHKYNSLNELVKARFVEMFGDPFINEKGWKTGKLSELCKINYYKAKLKRMMAKYGY